MAPSGRSRRRCISARRGAADRGDAPDPVQRRAQLFTYDPARQTLTFDELSVDSAWGSGHGEGRAYLGGIEDGTLTDLVGQFTYSSISLNPAGLYPEPLQLAGGMADFRLELAPFRLTLGQMRLADAGGGVDLSGALSADEDGWRLALDGHRDRISPARLLELWPATLAEKPRDWVERTCWPEP